MRRYYLRQSHFCLYISCHAPHRAMWGDKLGGNTGELSEVQRLHFDNDNRQIVTAAPRS